jgi:hypothetical protein
VNIPPALAADLLRLAEGGEPTERGLDVLLGGLAASAAAAVESFLGLSATVSTGTGSFTAVLIEDGTAQHQVRTAVRIPLGVLGSVVLLAGVAGALVDLAADLAVALGVPPGDVVLDADLALPDLVRAHRELDELTVLNQAVGVLLARGLTVDEARAALVRRGASDGTGVLGAARALLASLVQRGPASD